MELQRVVVGFDVFPDLSKPSDGRGRDGTNLAHKIPFLNVSRIGVVGVGGRDHPEGERVESEFPIEFEADLETLPGKSGLKGAAGFLSWLARRENLAEVAFLVGGADPQSTLRGSLDLVHLGQRFAALAQAPVFGAIGLPVPCVAAVEQTPALVHIVRDREEVTWRSACLFQSLPEFDCVADIQRGDGMGR